MYIENLEGEFRRLQKQLEHVRVRMHGVVREMNLRDKEAIDAYHESQRDVHNLHARAWSELSEETKNEWRKANGIRPACIFNEDETVANYEELRAWDTQKG